MNGLIRHIPPVALHWDDTTPGRSWQSLDATLVFADISGFTALTERLSARGRIGAEQIIDTLNGIFGAMLVAASSRGGQLLKYGGDALFFLFHGPDHTDRGCDAAVEMRTMLRKFRPPDDVGRLRLSMSVGIHSGEVLLFLVGQPTRELLVLGPAATAVIGAEKIARAGQIVLSEATALRLPTTATRLEGGANLLIRRKPASEANWMVRQAPEPGLQQHLSTLCPPDLAEYLAAGTPEPEHRTACIAFLRFSGTDALLAQHGPEPVAAAVGDLVTRVEAALAAERVTLLATDVDGDGGKFYLATGVPRASEDDEGRMLRAMRALVQQDLPLPVQVGVNRGHVFAAEVGAGFRSAYAAMGDTTNTAARIMSKAPAGRIYAAPAVLDHARTRFAVEPVGPFPMKGKKDPVPVLDVGAELGPRDVRTASDLPLVGRDAELREVRAAIDRARSGTGGVLTIAGAPGIGKSRLWAEALAGCGLPVLGLRAEPYGASSAYRVFRDPVRAMLGIESGRPEAMGTALLAALQRIAPQLVPMAPLLADLLTVEVPGTAEAAAIEPRFRPDRLASTAMALLTALRPGPLAIVVEEAHWVDAASQRLLQRMAEATARRPWLLTVIHRGDGAGFAPDTGSRIDLGPLPAEAVRALVIAAADATPLRPHEIDAIVDRASGSPLFVAEAMRTVSSAGRLGELPESIGGVLAAQIDQLHPQTRRVLRYSAVLGRSFRRELLREVLRTAGIAVDRAVINDLGGFLEPDGPQRYRFRNSLVRDAAYEGLAYRTRARLHGQAGAAMERLSTNLDADSAALSLHFAEAADHPRTLRYARRAGDAARRTYANAVAAELYERAVGAARHVPGFTEEASLLLALGEVRELAGILDGATDAYRRAFADAVDLPVRLEALVRLARVLEREGERRAALHAVARARRLIEETPDHPDVPRYEAHLDTLQALIKLGQEKGKQARKWALRAVDSARAAGEPEALVQALVALDFADNMLGRSVDGTHLREALELSVAHGFRTREAIARGNLGFLAFYAGRWSEAVEWYTSSRKVDEEAGNAYGAAETDLSLAEILLYQGKAAQAEGILFAAVRTLEAFGMESERSYGEMLLAKAALARGAPERAEALAEHAMAQFQQMEQHVTALEAALVLAELRVAGGAPEAALALLAEAEAAAKGETAGLQPALARIRARAAQLQGDQAEAQRLVRAGLAAARELQLPYEEALLMLLEADVDAAGVAADQVDRAQRILADLGAVTA